MNDPHEPSSSTTDATAQQRTLHERLRNGPSTLYDRQDQFRQLHAAFHKALNDPLHRVALVSGNAGTGKSKLVVGFLEQVRRENNKTIILQGKFDQFQQSSSAQDTIAAAFAQATRWLNEDPELRARVEQAVGLDTGLLVQIIPGLAGSVTIPFVSGEGKCAEDVAVIKSKKRATFLKFVRALSSPAKPVVLFIDDLQWASNGDFGVLTSILLEQEINGLFVVIACRNVAVEHRLSVFLQSLESQIEIKDILVSNLSLEAVSEYLSELLGEQKDTTLARYIFSKTAGNSLFLKELLATLLEEQNLFWREGSWYWDLKDLDEIECDQDNLSFIANKVRQLSPEMQDLLKVAACLGSTFDVDAIRNLVKPSKEQRLEELLHRGQEIGLLLRSAAVSLTYCFAHDRIQQASYNLIPKSERAAFHLAIGRSLRDRMDEGRLQAMSSIVACQLFLGHGLIDSHKERIHTAALLLGAGKQQVQMSNFDGAGHFFNCGLKLLGEDCWTCCYDLAIELYNANAEVSYILADFERLDTLTDTVCKNAKTFDDTIQIHTTHVYSLGARNNLHDAIAEGFDVLDKLDEPVPRSVSSFRLLAQHVKTNRKMSHLSVRNILNLPEMTDLKKLASLRLLNILFFYMFWKGDNKQALYLAIHSVQVTLQHGLSGTSAMGLAVYAGFFCALGKIERGCLMARVAVSVVEKFNAREWTGRALVFASMANLWKVPPSELTGIFEFASQSCFETGDIEFALLARFWLYATLFLAGEKDLVYVFSICKSLYDQMHQYKQHALRSICAPPMQMIANFAGQSESPMILTGAFMDEREVLTRASSDQFMSRQLVQVHIWKLTLATFFWDFELARDQLKRYECVKPKNEMNQTVVIAELFYGGIALLSTDRPEVRKAKRKLGRLKSLCRHAPLLHVSKICLLEAELAVAAGNPAKATEKFLSTIAHSQREKVLQDQALACERIFLFLRKEGKMTEAIYYLNEAKRLYQTWGCVAKVRQLDDVATSRR